MSRLREALVFRTDDERLAWFSSLTLDEQAEVMSDVKQIIRIASLAFQQMSEQIMAWWEMASVGRGVVADPHAASSACLFPSCEGEDDADDGFPF